MYIFFFFNDTATTEIYTLSLHDALPICVAPSLGETRAAAHVAQHGELFGREHAAHAQLGEGAQAGHLRLGVGELDRKSTRLNSSHANISYAVFCLKKKNN